MKAPLKSIDVSGELYDTFACIHVMSIYHNPLNVPIESNYNFCLDPNAVIDSFTIKIGDRTISGKVEEKSKAKKTYSNAIKNNKKSSLLQKNGDMYTVTIGNIEPLETITITYTYITSLTMVNGHYMFVYPTNIGERYGIFCNPVTTLEHKDKTNISTHIENTNSASHVIYINLVCKTNSKIKNVYSLTAEITQTIISDGERVIRLLTLPSKGDFNLFVDTEITSCVYTGSSAANTHYMVTHKIENEDVEYVPKEYIFVLDRSGSMSGTKMTDAKLAIRESLKLLKNDSYFNVVSFGDSYSAMFENSVIASKDNVYRAVEITKTYDADMGGTEIYNCLTACFDSNIKVYDCAAPKNDVSHLEKIIIFLTDGQISNTHQVYNLIKQQNTNNKNIRIFSIGIGSDASRDLIKNMSDLTSGISQMVIDSKDISQVSQQMITDTNKKFYKNLSILVDGKLVEYLGTDRIYPNQCMTAFFTLDNEIDSVNKNNDIEVIISGFCNLEQKQWQATKGKTEIDFLLLEKLYANELIKSGLISDEKIIKLSVDYNIMNNLTSFVMVDDIVSDIDNNEMIKTNIPQAVVNMLKLSTHDLKCNPPKPQIEMSPWGAKFLSTFKEPNVDNNIKNTISNVVDDLDNFNDFYDDLCFETTTSASGCIFPDLYDNNYPKSGGLIDPIKYEKCDALDGGMDMFGGGTYNVYDYSIFKHFEKTNSWVTISNESINIVTTLTLDQIMNLSVRENLAQLVIFNIIVLLYLKKFGSTLSSQHNISTTNLEKWLNSNISTLRHEQIIKMIESKTKTPVNKVCCGDY